MNGATAGIQRILRLANDFADELRTDLERAAADGSDIPPRLRSVQDRAGHASAEYRTLAVPIPAHVEGASPTVLSAAIARYAAQRSPACLLLGMDIVGTREDGGPQSLFVVEARDREGNRFFLAQPFTVTGGRIDWGDPANGEWRDPGEEEMILDAAFERR